MHCSMPSSPGLSLLFTCSPVSVFSILLTCLSLCLSRFLCCYRVRKHLFRVLALLKSKSRYQQKCVFRCCVSHLTPFATLSDVMSPIFVEFSPVCTMPSSPQSSRCSGIAGRLWIHAVTGHQRRPILTTGSRRRNGYDPRVIHRSRHDDTRVIHRLRRHDDD